jgi:hypothetical protein
MKGHAMSELSRRSLLAGVAALFAAAAVPALPPVAATRAAPLLADLEYIQRTLSDLGGRISARSLLKQVEASEHKLLEESDVARLRVSAAQSTEEADNQLLKTLAEAIQNLA